MRRRPYSVLLFDEVEKAHKNVLNVLLQVRGLFFSSSGQQWCGVHADPCALGRFWSRVLDCLMHFVCLFDKQGPRSWWGWLIIKGQRDSLLTWVLIVLRLPVQVMDDGRLTDSKGRVVDFRNTVLILTSNVGADILLRDVAKHGKLTAPAKKEVMKRLRAHFLPEFLNRADDIIMFSPLSRKSLTAILQQQVRIALVFLYAPRLLLQIRVL